MWEGLDGSKVLTHFPPADTYNAHCTAEELIKSVKNFKVVASFLNKTTILFINLFHLCVLWVNRIATGAVHLFMFLVTSMSFIA